MVTVLAPAEKHVDSMAFLQVFFFSQTIKTIEKDAYKVEDKQTW